MGANTVRIEPLRPDEAERVLGIYRAGIDRAGIGGGDAT